MRNSVLYKRQCAICGRDFMARRIDANYCNQTSTCRVKASRAKKAAQLEADRMTLDMDDYNLLMSITESGSNERLYHHLVKMLDKYGKEALHDVMYTILFVKGLAE